MVFGSSGGATVAIETLIQYPEWVTGMIVHEPALPTVLSPEERRGAPQQDDRIGRAMREAGPRAAIDVRLRLVIGDDVWEAQDERLRQRMLGNAETLFFVEAEAWGRYQPDEIRLAKVGQPVIVLTSADSPPLNLTIRDWLIQHIPGAASGILPGRHVPYLESPDETAGVLRGFFKEMVRRSRSGEAIA
jgi:pimeloyl-ACP methyl ester carboxylesterase